MQFFVFRLNQIKILNNREWREGEVKLLSSITGMDEGLPVLDGLKSKMEDYRCDRFYQE